MSFRKLVSSHSMGIEIETFFVKGVLELYDHAHHTQLRQQYGHVGFFTVQGDASISDSQEYIWGTHLGIEFASQPLPPAWLKKEIQRLRDKLGMDWLTGSACGIHIHVNRGWLSEKAAKNIQKFYASLSSEDKTFLFGRDSNYYCRPDWNKNSRYMAINITNKDTIEFRMFKSGGVKWAQYCIDMVEYLIRNNKTLNIHAAAAFAEMKQPKEL